MKSMKSWEEWSSETFGVVSERGMERPLSDIGIKPGGLDVERVPRLVPAPPIFRHPNWRDLPLSEGSAPIHSGGDLMPCSGLMEALRRQSEHESSREKKSEEST